MGLVRDAPVEVQSAIATVTLRVCLASGALVAAGVAVGSEECACSVGIHIVYADVGVEVDVHVELLVGIDVRGPGRETRHGVGTHTHAEQFVARNLLVGDDIDNTARGRIAGRGVGDNLDTLDGVGGHLLDILLQSLLVHVGWTVV